VALRHPNFSGPVRALARIKLGNFHAAHWSSWIAIRGFRIQFLSSVDE
jgi:hypothetical protein